MANITKINIDGIEYSVSDQISGYTSFNYTSSQSSNENIVGTMTFNGSTYTIYAPDLETTETLSIDLTDNNTNLRFRHSS